MWIWRLNFETDFSESKISIQEWHPVIRWILHGTSWNSAILIHQKVHLSQSFSVNKLHIQPCIGVCANLLEVVEVATPLHVMGAMERRFGKSSFPTDTPSESWEFSIAILGDFCQRVNHLWFRVSLSWEDHRMKYSAPYGHSFSLAKWFRAAHRRHFEFPNLAVCQNLVPLVNIKIAGKWMFIPLKMVLIGIDP